MDLAVSLNPTLFIQFTDDAVDMTSDCQYINTSRESDMLDYPLSNSTNSGNKSYHLILSPCGSQFVFSKEVDQLPVNPSGGLRVPLQLPNRIVQRTACVITTFTDHVASALALRNRFAERPFVARPLLSKSDSLFESKMELRDARWPTRFAEAAIERLSDGAIKWTSFDSYSSITLFANKHEVSIRFPVRVPDSPSSKSSDRSRGSRAGTAVPAQTASLYTYVSSCYSVLDVPARWQSPVSLLLRWNSRLSPSSSDSASSSASDAVSADGCCSNFGEHLVTQLPRELPFACALQHLHRTHFELEHHIDRLMETSSSSGSQTSGPEVQLQHQQQKGDLFQSLLHRRPKIIFRNGIHYRLIYGDLAKRCVQATLPDGSALISRGLAGIYFDHYIPSDGQIEQRVYSKEAAPPIYRYKSSEPNEFYCLPVPSILQFIHCLCELMLSDSALSAKPVPFCWSQSDEPVCTKKPSSRSSALGERGNTSRPAPKAASGARFAELASAVLEEHSVPHVGRFVLFASGRVRCVLADRNIVETRLGVRRLRPLLLAQRTRALECTHSAALLRASVLSDRGSNNSTAPQRQLPTLLSESEIDDYLKTTEQLEDRVRCSAGGMRRGELLEGLFQVLTASGAESLFALEEDEVGSASRSDAGACANSASSCWRLLYTRQPDEVLVASPAASSAAAEGEQIVQHVLRCLELSHCFLGWLCTSPRAARLPLEQCLLGALPNDPQQDTLCV